MVTMATVVMVTTIWLFFRPFGPKAHLYAKFREDRVVNTRDNWRPTFALYIYNVYMKSWQLAKMVTFSRSIKVPRLDLVGFCASTGVPFVCGPH